MSGCDRPSVRVQGAIFGAVIVLALLVGVAAPAGAAGANCASVNLQDKIDAASPGATLPLKGGCVGSFTIAKDLTLKGSPSAVLDGGNAGSVLTITGNRKVNLIGLSITGGVAQTGGGINRTGGGKLTLDHVLVTNNLSTGPSPGLGA